MEQKILVAVDLSPMARIVFAQALSFAKTSGASLILLQVLSPYEEGAPTQILSPFEEPILPDVWQTIVEEYEKQWRTFQEKGFVALQTMKNEALELDINTRIIQIFGSPGPTICQQAEKLAVDLIMIGNRGRSGLKELFLGSVSN